MEEGWRVRTAVAQAEGATGSLEQGKRSRESLVAGSAVGCGGVIGARKQCRKAVGVVGSGMQEWWWKMQTS